METFPTDGKVGMGFKGEGGGTFGVMGGYTSTRRMRKDINLTSGSSVKKKKKDRREASPTELGSMIGFSPLTIQFRIKGRGCTNP